MTISDYMTLGLATIFKINFNILKNDYIGIQTKEPDVDSRPPKPLHHELMWLYYKPLEDFIFVLEQLHL